MIRLVLDEGAEHERQERVPLELFCAALFEALGGDQKSRVVGAVLATLDNPAFDPEGDIPIPARTRRTAPLGPPAHRVGDDVADRVDAHRDDCAALAETGPCDCPPRIVKVRGSLPLRMGDPGDRRITCSCAMRGTYDPGCLVHRRGGTA